MNMTKLKRNIFQFNPTGPRNRICHKMGSSGSCFRPLFMFLLFVAVTTVLMMAFYYRSAAVTSPLPSDKPPRESLAARSLLGAVEVFKPYSGEQPILTMFTTFKNAKDRFQIHSNVLHNWALYIPVIQPILFTHDTDENLIKIAKSLGWRVIPSPRVSDSKVPYFKEMYFEAQKQVESVFYGYFNGDLLFDDGLVNTLVVVERYLDQLHKTLIVGQRTNFPVKDQKIYRKADVSAMARKKGKLFRMDAEDFFIIAHNTFVWDKIADIVIGRPAYDNYIVGMALKNKVAVVDATKTLLALHQSGTDGDFAGHKNKDRNFNFKAIGPFNWGSGVTSASQYFTKYKDGNIELWMRSPAKKLVAKVRTTPNPPILNSTEAPTLLSTGNKTYNPSSNHTAYSAQEQSANNSKTSSNSTLLSIHVKVTPFTNSTKSANLTLENTSIKSNSYINTGTFNNSSNRADILNYRTSSRDSEMFKDNSMTSTNSSFFITQRDTNSSGHSVS